MSRVRIIAKQTIKKHYNVWQLLVLKNKLQVRYNPDLQLVYIEDAIKTAHNFKGGKKINGRKLQP